MGLSHGCHQSHRVAWVCDGRFGPLVAPVALDVVVNGRALAKSIERSELAGEAARRGGVMVELGRAGGAVVVR